MCGRDHARRSVLPFGRPGCEARRRPHRGGLETPPGSAHGVTMNGQSTGIHGQTLEFSRLTTQDLSLPSSRLVVSTQCVQVHAFSLEASADVQARCVGWLSPDERNRMQRFRFEDDRHHYIVGHGFLRYVLGRYCDLDPVQLKFGTLSGGKPALVDEESSVSRLRFNLTHSHGRALLAVADGIE